LFVAVGRLVKKDRRLGKKGNDCFVLGTCWKRVDEISWVRIVRVLREGK